MSYNIENYIASYIKQMNNEKCFKRFVHIPHIIIINLFIAHFFDNHITKINQDDYKN